MTCSVGHVSPVTLSQMIPSPPIGSLLNVSSRLSTALMATHSNQLANISMAKVLKRVTGYFMALATYLILQKNNGAAHIVASSFPRNRRDGCTAASGIGRLSRGKLTRRCNLRLNRAR
jgi:hypothetical protein